MKAVRFPRMRWLRRHRCPECGVPVRQTFCSECGYDLIRKTRDQAFTRPF